MGSFHNLGYGGSHANPEHGWFTLHCPFKPWHVCASNHNSSGHVSYPLVHRIPAGAHPHPSSSSNIILGNGLTAQRSAVSSGTWRAALWVCSHQLLGRHIPIDISRTGHLFSLALLTQFNTNFYRSYFIFQGERSQEECFQAVPGITWVSKLRAHWKGWRHPISEELVK